MKRLLIMTIGKTHSGKSTFAKALEKRMPNSIVVDQDNHAEILQTYYPALVPQEGPNTIKYALTQTIVDYAVNETNCHVILCNSNRNHKGRMNILDYYHEKEFTSILVNFDILAHVLEERIRKSRRSTTILRTTSSFEEVLTQQQNETFKDNLVVPSKSEADYLFVIKNANEVESIISKIIEIAQNH
ncbi:AAA family ATPase [Planococcus shenhongbingii]|uniref:AAA family ATPase n=1 Tax=Planococcus shenhongbingii TaxID=3058398 RepID=A0ABT8N8D0_9BACL|nr:AAA family ATPase [Planococcus sp. N017]MDN7243907.1 AAA family ATPase [Planococcus sp. N017]